MLNKILLASFMFTSVFLQAQEKKNSKQYHFGIEVVAQVVGAEFVPAQVLGNNFNRRHVSWGTNFFITKKLSDRFAAKTGIGYRYNSTVEMWRGLIFANDIDPLTGVVKDPLDINIKLAAHYFSVPIAIICRIGEKLKIDTGLEVEFFVNGSTEFTYNRAPTDPFFRDKKVNTKSPLFNAYLGCEVEIFDLMYIKPFVNLRKIELWQLGGGLRFGKMIQI